MSWLLILFTMALVGCDHVTKAVAQATLERRAPLSIVPGVLDLRYAENRDVAFSSFGEHCTQSEVAHGRAALSHDRHVSSLPTPIPAL